MNLTIIPIDGTVYVEGISWSSLDLSTCGIPSNVHALQWKNTKGWIEYIDNDDGTKPANEQITELPNWAILCKDKWDEAKAAQEAAIEALAVAALDQPVTQGLQQA